MTATERAVLARLREEEEKVADLHERADLAWHAGEYKLAWQLKVEEELAVARAITLKSILNERA